MGVSLYEGISKNELNSARITSEGKSYTINHPDELLVNMRYKGNTGSNVNSQGWERSSSYYFKELQSRHPEYFSKKNNLLIESGRSPIVDKRFADVFPQYKDYKGETLVHHHIGQDGQAVALPQSIHKGYGEIHAVENNLGITDKAQAFSSSCGEACKKNPSLYGQTSDKFNPELGYSKDSAAGNKWAEAMKGVPSYSEHMKQIKARSATNQNAFKQATGTKATISSQSNAFSRTNYPGQNSSRTVSSNAIKSVSNTTTRTSGSTGQSVSTDRGQSASRSK